MSQTNWTALLQEQGKLYEYIMQGTTQEKETAILHLIQVTNFVDKFNMLPTDKIAYVNEILEGTKQIPVLPKAKGITVNVNKSNEAKSFKEAITKMSKIVNKSNTLPVLDCAHLATDGWLTVSNLDMYYEFQTCVTGTEALIPFEFIKQFGKDEKLVSVKQIGKLFEYDVTTNKKSFKIHTSDPSEFPKQPKIDQPMKFELKYQDVMNLKKYIQFSSKDEIRPVMMGAFLSKENKEICITDAHKLAWVPLKSDVPKDTIIPKKAIGILFEGFAVMDYQSMLVSNNSERFQTRLEPGKYPNYQNVIPKDNPITLTINRVELIDKCKQAIQFANRTTHQVAFTVNRNGVIDIKSEDLDFNSSYKGNITCNVKEIRKYIIKYNNDKGTEKKLEIRAKDDESAMKEAKKLMGAVINSVELIEDHVIQIGFNGNFLLEGLMAKEGVNVEIELSEPNRAGILDGKFLLMPVMLNV